MLNDWRVFALLSACFAALTAIFGKIGVATINSSLATFVRTIVILVFAAGIVSFERAWRVPSDLSQRGMVFLVLSGIATGASWLCYYRALQMGPASKVAPVDKLSVAITIILAILFLGETLSWKVALGAALILAGSLLVMAG